MSPTVAGPGRALAVIPARGGSKGVPRKNLAVVAGRSLLERAIRTAQEAASIDTVVVSTDDPEIADAGRACGARIVERPPELATDTSPTPPTITHALDVLAAAGQAFDIVVLLQPPAPLRTPLDVDAAVAMLTDRDDLDAVVSVYQVGDAHPGRMYRRGADDVLEALWPDLERMRRQDLPPVFHRNGAIYAARSRVLRDTGELMAGRIGAYEMDPGWTVNIDTADDLAIADLVVGRWDERDDGTMMP